MTAEIRLFTVETHRSVAVLVFAALLGLFWLTDRFATRDFGERGVVLWTEASSIIANGAALLGPVAGGLAAWAAGRDRRRGVEDLLATTPRPAARRDLTLVAATVAWGLLAYFIVAVYVGAVTARYATWGGPLAAPIVVGAATVVVCAAVGYAVGAVPQPGGLDRLIPALVPIALFVLLLLPTMMQTPPAAGDARPAAIQRLSPWGIIDEYTSDVFARPSPTLLVAATAWFLGVSGTALAVVMLRRRRTAVEWGALAGAGGVAVVAALLLVRSSFAAAPVPYEPACVRLEGAIPVCLHPAYAAVLDETAAIVAEVLRPLVSVPGAPIRVDQGTSSAFGWQSDGIFGVIPYEPRLGHDGKVVASEVAGSVAHGSSWYVPELVQTTDSAVLEAQDAIALWLLRQAGWTDESSPRDLSLFTLHESSMGDDPVLIRELQAREARIVAAADRFAALDPATQRAWLEAHFAALQAGSVRLADLPGADAGV